MTTKRILGAILTSATTISLAACGGSMHEPVTVVNRDACEAHERARCARQRRQNREIEEELKRLR